MAEATVLDDKALFLYLGRWGSPTPNAAVPKNGFAETGGLHHNVAAAAYRPGTVVSVYQDGSGTGRRGWSEFTYLQFNDSETTLTTTVVAKNMCLHDVLLDPYSVTTDKEGDVADAVVSGQVAYTISAMTSQYYGWFWTGGVVPVDYVAALNGSFAGVGTAGDVIIPIATAWDATTLALYNDFSFTTITAVTDVAIGWVGATAA